MSRRAKNGHPNVNLSYVVPMPEWILRFKHFVDWPGGSV